MNNLPTITSFTCDASVIKTTSDQSYTGRCTIGNLQDYVFDHKDFILDEIAQPEILNKINIVIPIYHSGTRVLPTIRSILNSDWDVPVELVCFVNKPESCSVEAQESNELTFNLLTDIFTPKKTAIGRKFSFSNEVDELRNIFSHRRKLKVLLINKTLRYGVGEVLQLSISSYLARIYNYAVNHIVDDSDNNESIAKKANYVKHLCSNTVLIFHDDDIVAKSGELRKIYSAICEKDKIGVGQATITKIISTQTTDQTIIECLKLIMQSWLIFKDDLGINFLSPKSASLLQLLHFAPDVELGTKYDDQKLFAILAKKLGNGIHRIPIDTVIAERESFVGNSGFVRQLRLYLEGKIEDMNELSFLTNVAYLYATEKGHSFDKESYSNFLKLIREREIENIISFCKNICGK